MTMETKFKIIADSEAGTWAVNIWCELGIPPTTVWTSVADKQKYKEGAKLNIFLKFNSIHICMYKICIYLINCY
jgi:hypothetical protein